MLPREERSTGSQPKGWRRHFRSVLAGWGIQGSVELVPSPFLCPHLTVEVSSDGKSLGDVNW